MSEPASPDVPEFTTLHPLWMFPPGNDRLSAFLILMDLIGDHLEESVIRHYGYTVAQMMRHPLREQVWLMLEWSVWTKEQFDEFQRILAVRQRIMSKGEEACGYLEMDRMNLHLTLMLGALYTWRPSRLPRE